MAQYCNCEGLHRCHVSACTSVVVLFLIHITTTTTTTTETPGYASQANLVFLSKVIRLGNSDYVDYYFCCNVIGEYIDWQYNNVPLHAFLAGRIYNPVVNSGPGFDYIITLLSSIPDSDNSRQAHFSSVMVLSFRGSNDPNGFTVQCSSHASFTVHAMDGNTAVEPVGDDRRRNNGSLVFDYVLSRKIVTSRSKTHIFICGVSSNLQFLQMGDRTIGFSRHDSIGGVKNVFSPDSNTVDIQGILIDRDQFQTTTLLLVSDDSDVITVSCFYDEGHFESLSSNNTSSNISSTPTESMPLSNIGSISGIKSISDLDSMHTMTSSIEEALNVNLPASVSLLLMSSPTSILKNTESSSAGNTAILLGIAVPIAILMTVMVISIAGFFYRRSVCSVQSSHKMDGNTVEKRDVLIDGGNPSREATLSSNPTIKPHVECGDIQPQEAMESSKSQKNDDLNSWPLQVENGGNQVAELVVSGRLSREIVIPDDEGTIIRESNTTPASIYLVSTNDGLTQRIVTPQEISVPPGHFFLSMEVFRVLPSTVSCIQTLKKMKAGRLRLDKLVTPFFLHL